MPFIALEVSLDLIRSLNSPLEQIRTRSCSLADQIDDAAASVALNLGEGRRRSGKDRVHLFRIAAGSADEVRTALRVAEARGQVDRNAIAAALQLCDRLLALTWGLTH